jgi:nucleotide-binding universal stress UspA family protein
VHIVVATDGSLDPTDTAELVEPLAGESTVTVLTAVEIPRRLLADLRAVYGEQHRPVVDSDGEYVGISPQQPGLDFDFPGDDAIIDRYLANQLEERTAPMQVELKERGIDATVEILDGENEAQLILDYLRANKADLVVLGTKGRGLFEGMLGSTGVKVSRLAPCSVLLIRV